MEAPPFRQPSHQNNTRSASPRRFGAANSQVPSICNHIPSRFELPSSRTLEFSGIITNDCVLCFFTLAQLISKYDYLNLVEFPCAGKIFLKNFRLQAETPSRAQILIHLSFNLCKNRSAYSRINTVIIKSNVPCN